MQLSDQSRETQTDQYRHAFFTIDSFEHDYHILCNKLDEFASVHFNLTNINLKNMYMSTFRFTKFHTVIDMNLRGASWFTKILKRLILSLEKSVLTLFVIKCLN